VRENCTPGSVRGASGNRRPYLDRRRRRRERPSMPGRSSPQTSPMHSRSTPGALPLVERVCTGFGAGLERVCLESTCRGVAPRRCNGAKQATYKVFHTFSVPQGMAGARDAARGLQEEWAKAS